MEGGQDFECGIKYGAVEKGQRGGSNYTGPLGDRLVTPSKNQWPKLLGKHIPTAPTLSIELLHFCLSITQTVKPTHKFFIQSFIV